MNHTIAVPISSQIVGELFLRKGPNANISDWIENVVLDYLDRTADNEGWSEAFYAYRAEQVGAEEFIAKFGDPKGGLHWSQLFLPNGTSISMNYRGTTHTVAVKFGKIEYNGKQLSPSELAREIASGTSRNAWRDLMIKRPGDSEWTLADVLRRQRSK